MLWKSLTGSASGFVFLSVLTGFFSLFALHRCWFSLAAAGAAATVATVIGGWALGQYPAIIPPTITVQNAAAPENVLWLFIVVAGLGSLLLVPSLLLLFWVFKGQATPTQEDA